MSYATKYLLFSFIFIAFVACNSSKKPKKEEEIKDKNSTFLSSSHLGSLSPKQKSAKKALDAYLQELATFNTDNIVEMTYPRLFLAIDLDLYRQYIASMMNSTDIEMTSYESNITKLSPVTTFSNGVEFAQAQYISKVTIHFLNDALYDTQEKMNFLYDALIHKYGRENIHIDIKKRLLTIKKEEKLLLIKEKDSDWKFLGDNIHYRKLYPSFLPHEILKILNQEEHLNLEEKSSNSIERRDTNETT